MESTRSKRLFEVDIVKAFAIFFMVVIHVYEQLSVYDHRNVMPDSMFRIIIEFLGGPLAAPVFMFCMGIGMVYTRHDSATDFRKRGLKLLLIGYALNFFRQTLLQLIGLLLGIESDLDIIGGFLNVDIMEFAGMSFLFVGLLKQLKLKSHSMLMVAILMQTVGIWTTRITVRSMTIQCLIGLLLPTGKWVAFPLFLWIIYPVTGIIFGEWIRKVSDRSKLYRKLLLFSGSFSLSYSLVIIYFGWDMKDFFALCNDKYYHQTLMSTLWIIPIVVFALCVSYFLFGFLEKKKAGALISCLSINLNRIYIIQWLIIAYSVAAITVSGKGKMSSPLMICLVGVIVVIFAVCINAIYLKVKKRVTVDRSPVKISSF